MKFQAFRMKTTSMFFIVVYDHPRSKFFYALNVYHALIERMEKKCWKQADYVYDIVDINELSSSEFIRTKELLCPLSQQL